MVLYGVIRMSRLTMKHNGEHFDLQSQLFNDDSCRGCAFINTPCCMEIVGTDCSKHGVSSVWVKVEDEK